MLILARLMGEVVRKLRFPFVVGEILAGLLLGKTVLGNLSPHLTVEMFPSSGNVPLALNGITSLAAIMMLFVAGMEIELPLVLKEGKKAIITSIGALIVPLLIGAYIGYFHLEVFHIRPESKRVFALFLGTALSITALPVMARILLDLGLLKSKVGTIIIAAAMLNDLVGWLIFSIILGLIQEHREASLALWQTIALTFIYTILILTGAKWLINKSLPWFQKKFAWPGGVLSLAFGMCFLGAAFTEYIGIHAIFGAFILGIAFGDSEHMTKDARVIIQQFVTNIFAPLFFVSIGLRLNFIENFDLTITIWILVAALASKLLGGFLGAKISGLNYKESLAVGFGMNARGAMEIILANLALEAHLIDEKIFVSLVIMAIVTSMISGPMLSIFCKDV
ncbi:MAG: cation:proton antiporter, partial [Bacteroidetes bacterium]|nr:cation:proton antiporter [Bacteroidota bacterium]